MAIHRTSVYSCLPSYSSRFTRSPAAGVLAIVVVLLLSFALPSSAAATISNQHRGWVYVRAGQPAVTTYLWHDRTWHVSNPSARSRVWVQPFSGRWMWMYHTRRWYAVDRADLRKARPAVIAGDRPASPRPRAAALATVSPATDNYKARFNANPAATELRTWLSWKAIRVGGRNYRPVQGAPVLRSQLSMRSTDGRRIVLRVHSASANAAFTSFRVGPQAGYSGVFMQIRNRTTLVRNPIRLRITASTPGGRRLASRTLHYRYDRSLANAPASSLEHNGPGGRWYVGSRRTRTNVEIGRH